MDDELDTESYKTYFGIARQISDMEKELTR